MKRLYPTVIALCLGFAAIANDETSATDSTKMENIIDIDVVSPGESKGTKEEIPQRINSLSKEKNTVCRRISNFHESLKWKRKKQLILTTTGYYKPSITYGLDELKSATDHICKKLDDEIQYILAFNDLDQDTSGDYVHTLVEMRTEVESEFNKIPNLLSRKLR